MPPLPHPRLSGHWPDLVVALAAALVAGSVSWILAAPIHARQSPAPHFVLLADAMLHGRLWIDPVRGANLGDVTPYGGHLYIAFPPLPALLMVPFVAAAGPGFNDARFSLLLGAANAGLTYLLIRRLGAAGFAGPGVPLGRGEALTVAALFALGTVHAYAAPMGRVWFTAHIVAVTGLLLYLLECSGRGRPLVAGGTLAAAALARPPVVLGAVFWLLLATRTSDPAGRWSPESPECPEGTLRSRLALVPRFFLPIVLGGVLMLLQNAVRFGNPLDFGYLGMRVAPVLAPDLRDYGQFHPHFLARNLQAFLLTPPAVDLPGLAGWSRQSPDLPHLWRRLVTPGAWRDLVRFDPWGTGLWAVSPVLLVALRRTRPQDKSLAGAAGAASLAVAVPDLLYYNTGWVQYGYRFALDFLPFLLILVALGLRRPFHLGRAAFFVLLLLLSIVSNLVGMRWFLRLPPF